MVRPGPVRRLPTPDPDDSPTTPSPRRQVPALYLPTWSQLRIATKQCSQVSSGGDFFEVFQNRDGCVSTVMADVAGNGPSAAAHVSQVRWGFRQQLARGAPPGQVLAVTNDWLASLLIPDWFVTALCARIDVRTGRTEIAGAGHLGPFLKRASGTAEHLTLPPALALGIFPGEVYAPITVDLLPDDALVLVTDGITDRLATPADPLGDRALVRLLTGSPRATPLGIEQICEVLLGPQPARGIDATVVALQIPPGRRPRVPTPSSGTG